MTTNRSEYELSEMGKEAADRYINADIPMNDTIEEMAKTALLNSNQIARVCEAANTATYNALFEKTGSCNFEFVFADQEKIAEDLNREELPDVSLLDESLLSKESLASYLPETDELIDTDKDLKYKQSVKKLASDLNALNDSCDEFPLTRVNKALAKLAAFRDEIELGICQEWNNYKGGIEKTAEMMKEAALHGEDISSVYVAARTAFPDQTPVIKKAFLEIGELLRKNNISLVSNSKTASKTISENACGEANKDFVDRSHPIIKHINTITDSYYRCQDLRELDDYVVKKIEGLNNGLVKYRQTANGLEKA